MRTKIGTLAAVCLVIAGVGFAGAPAAAAQDQSAGATPPPNVLVINREFLKQGVTPSAHRKTESAIAQALGQANSSDHYLGMVSLSGRQHVLFLHGYDSFAEIQKSAMAEIQNSQLDQTLETDTQADDNLLSSKSTGIFVYQPDVSVNSAVDIPHMRVMEITEVKVRPGHNADWMKLMQLYNKIFGGGPNAHWAAYQMRYGSSDSIYLFLAPMKSLAGIDQDQQDSAKAVAAAGPDQMKQLDDLTATAVESIGSNLFVFAPNMSYVGAKWKSADPGFWKQ